ncbi:hypothetical protein CW304_10770 [Bacillus sp. UFRGS-B20]|nr:hypothetical protein CW304_10770 [Bacillus sp. UFRGS-B20]
MNNSSLIIGNFIRPFWMPLYSSNFINTLYSFHSHFSSIYFFHYTIFGGAQSFMGSKNIFIKNIFISKIKPSIEKGNQMIGCLYNT